MPSNELRRRLRGVGHGLAPVVQIGHHGVTEPVIRQITAALFDHELIKIKLGSECPEDRFTVAERLAEEPGVNVAQILGRTILLYKRHPQKPRYEGRAAAARATAGAERKPASGAAKARGASGAAKARGAGGAGKARGAGRPASRGSAPGGGRGAGDRPSRPGARPQRPSGPARAGGSRQGGAPRGGGSGGRPARGRAGGPRR